MVSLKNDQANPTTLQLHQVRLTIYMTHLYMVVSTKDIVLLTGSGFRNNHQTQ